MVTLRRERKLNALSAHMETELLSALRSPAVASSRAVVVTGGDRAFSAGADVTELREMTTQDIVDYYRGSGSVYEEFAALPQPTVAAITGYCLGGGLELALAADIRIADPAAVFGFPEIDIGILPSSGGVTRIARAVGAGRARDLVLRGRRFDADRPSNGASSPRSPLRATTSIMRSPSRTAHLTLRARTADHQKGAGRQPRCAEGGHTTARTAGLLGAQRCIRLVGHSVGKPGGVVTGLTLRVADEGRRADRSGIVCASWRSDDQSATTVPAVWSNDRHGRQWWQVRCPQRPGANPETRAGGVERRCHGRPGRRRPGRAGRDPGGSQQLHRQPRCDLGAVQRHDQPHRRAGTAPDRGGRPPGGHRRARRTHRRHR